MSAISDKIREMFGKSDAIRDAGLTTPDTVERFDDIPYGTDCDCQKLDVYRPKTRKGDTLPVIVSVHGGAWVYGDKELYQFYCMSLTQHGFAVVNFTYRLAPEHKFPAAVEDTNLVMRWLLAHGAEYGLDTQRVFAVGDSAGAHILGLYTALLTDPDYAAGYPFEPPAGLTLRAIGLNCGAYVVKPHTPGEEMTESLMGEYLPNGGSAEELAFISVANHVNAHFPPTCFMTSSGDFLKQQAPILQAKLLDKQVEHTFLFYGSAERELGHVFHLDMRSELAHRFNKEQCDFFKRYLD